ncbi:GNAT family N-acetyltransferase [Streptomyces antimycoticus]|uniref:GNAT family N-acetyltransferase n=4 Tax=Streptomyces TaxID=1883 RepID=A0ABD5JML5_9ACTN|nr:MULTISPECIES: GNAT family N-acetyltransferase [Streptomyces]MEE4588344.1 GNAT family N-acetyltransferase [Streptomyces sp. DSM 41602]KUL59392.1 acetyltransferase [Streptomyces violaceusniger]QTI89169.1 GNAT family N-acetyltransferase [Streptomyces sp. AgN23]RSS43586.1 GNAT family N-acetyltransferase [Streptomyces sp. WAC05858]WJD97676.1 GNAT family N-acetyltransferase [Streptomyces antimycoticus]
MNIQTIRYDHPDALKLDEEVQAEYAVRYGEGDLTPMDAAHFDPPHGLYLMAYDPDGTPVATGGWRSQERSDEGYEDGDAEIKRMFVVRAARGRGLARRILAALEDSAREAGRVRMVLETGTEQPEAIELYTSSGYTPVPKFGLYRFEEMSRCYAKLLTAAPVEPSVSPSAEPSAKPSVRP